jgi:hypothetical protein
MYRKPDKVGDFNLYYGRYASWVVHNMWGRNISDDVSPDFLQLPDNLPPDGRKAVKAVLSEFLATNFLNTPPVDYRPRDLIYYATPHTHEFTEGPNKGKKVEGMLGLVFATDDPTDKTKNIMVLSVQLPVSEDTALPGVASNCHLTTEIYPADGHSLIPVSYEFARGTIPGKRLNCTVNRDGSFEVLPQGQGVPIVKTGFKHFVSAAYSKDGIFQLDFQLDVRHRPILPEEQVHSADRFYATREEFDFRLEQEVSRPLQQIRQEIENDKGTLAPAHVNAGSFLAKVPAWVSDAAYTNMVIFRQEYDSNINPGLHRERFGKDVQVPVETEKKFDYTDIAGVLVLYPGALELALLLAGKKQVGTGDPELKAILPNERFLETLVEMGRADIIKINGSIISLTELGSDVVKEFRKKYKGGALYARS